MSLGPNRKNYMVAGYKQVNKPMKMSKGVVCIMLVCVFALNYQIELSYSGESVYTQDLYNSMTCTQLERCTPDYNIDYDCTKGKGRVYSDISNIYVFGCRAQLALRCINVTPRKHQARPIECIVNARLLCISLTAMRNERYCKAVNRILLKSPHDIIQYIMLACLESAGHLEFRQCTIVTNINIYLNDRKNPSGVMSANSEFSVNNNIFSMYTLIKSVSVWVFVFISDDSVVIPFRSVYLRLNITHVSMVIVVDITTRSKLNDTHSQAANKTRYCYINWRVPIVCVLCVVSIQCTSGERRRPVRRIAMNVGHWGPFTVAYTVVHCGNKGRQICGDTVHERHLVTSVKTSGSINSTYTVVRCGISSTVNLMLDITCFSVLVNITGVRYIPVWYAIKCELLEKRYCLVVCFWYHNDYDGYVQHK